MVKRFVEEWRETGEEAVRAKVSMLTEEIIRPTLSADAVQNKGSTRTHYVAILAHWVNKNWELDSICVGILDFEHGKRTMGT